MTLCMVFLASISMKRENIQLKARIIAKAAPLKEKVSFLYYRIAKEIAGIRHWYKTKRPRLQQLCLKLMA